VGDDLQARRGSPVQQSLVPGDEVGGSDGDGQGREVIVIWVGGKTRVGQRISRVHSPSVDRRPKRLEAVCRPQAVELGPADHRIELLKKHRRHHEVEQAVEPGVDDASGRAFPRDQG
jgi:hypothetical protein